jgi:hypothetical protein
MKGKEEEEIFFLHEHLCVNVCYSFYDNLIREEKKKQKNETTYKLRKRCEKMKKKKEKHEE